MSGVRFLPGYVVKVVREGGVSGRAFVGRKFTLTDWTVIDGETCWRTPEAWSAWMSQRRGFSFDLHMQEGRLEFVHDGNVKVGWEQCQWRPHEEVIPDPRNPGMLINVWDPLPVFLTGTGKANRVWPPAPEDPV